jgi:hypothetical protein
MGGNAWEDSKRDASGHGERDRRYSPETRTSRDRVAGALSTAFEPSNVGALLVKRFELERLPAQSAGAIASPCFRSL